MSKNRNSIKGEYNIGYSMNTTGVRNFQELLNSRLAGLSEMGDLHTPEHKMEFVKSIRGVDFVNDAACTNENGLFMALSDAKKQVTLVTSFTQWTKIEVALLQLIVQKVDSIVFFGEEYDTCRDFFDALNVAHNFSDDLETAVRMAFYGSSTGAMVLFSPGVPAGEEFAGSTSNRGTQFKNAVAQL